MSKGKRDLTADERRLWTRVASTLNKRRHLPPDEGPHEPAAKSTPARQPQQTVKKPAARLSASPPAPQNRSAEKRVRRGDMEIDSTLDLHGHTHDAALAALTRFLRRAHARGDRTVIVVTGVGRGGEGVLRRMFPTWLGAQAIRPLISGYAPAHRSHGGAGAFYVFIKRARIGPI